MVPGASRLFNRDSAGLSPPRRNLPDRRPNCRGLQTMIPAFWSRPAGTSSCSASRASREELICCEMSLTWAGIRGGGERIGDGQRFHEVPAAVVGAADIPNLAAPDEIVERPQGFFKRCQRVEVVGLIEIGRAHV